MSQKFCQTFGLRAKFWFFKIKKLDCKVKNISFKVILIVDVKILVLQGQNFSL